MKPRKFYQIEYYCEAPLDKWMPMSPGFVCMPKSYAEGAWAMLKSYYNQKRKHRLVCDGVVVDTYGLQTIHVN